MKATALLSLLLAALMVTGCPSNEKKPDPQPETGLQGGPEWFENRSGQQPNRIYGYGQSAGEAEPALARSSARASAQDEVAQFLSTRIQSLFQRYLDSTSAGGEAREVRDTREAVRRLTNQVLNGFEIDKTEIKGKYAYARGFIAFDRVKEAYRSNNELNKMVADVRADAAEFFAELDKQIEKDLKTGN